MKNLRRVSGMVTALSLVLSLVGPVSVFAATAPSLGVAETYAVFGEAGVTNDLSATTHIWGNVGGNAAGGGTGVTNLDDVTQVDGAIDAGANVPVANAVAAAYGELAGQGATGALDLAGTHTITPGVYTVGATTLNGTLTLSGAGVYILRSSSSISTSGAAVVSLTNGASACNVYWQIPTSMTIGAGTVMVGTIITNTGLISLASGASLKGRALAKTQVTLIANQITEPTCAAAAATGGADALAAGTITVVKNVINDNGGTKTGADFPLFMNGMPVVSGTTNTFFPAMVYDVTETSNTAQYARSFSGDCDANGRLSLNAGEAKTCIITNNDIGPAVVVPPVPPLIDVVKVPNPLALPNGPGPVTYTYTTRNIGTVPMSNVTLVGDTCSPIVLVSGDLNGNAKLDMNETWVYTCSTTLQATHTNTVVATGWANGISAVDIASATVVVGLPLVPPLIHITKVPSPLALRAGGGAVTYTYTVTNPGTAPLSNVGVTDDKCTGLPAQVSGHPGDLNKNNLLESNETWKFTCRSNLTETTTNTATARGEANGMTVKDYAVATVVVAAAVPALPKTGIAPTKNVIAWGVGAAGLLGISFLFYVLRKKQNV